MWSINGARDRMLTNDLDGLKRTLDFTVYRHRVHFSKGVVLLEGKSH